MNIQAAETPQKRRRRGWRCWLLAILGAFILLALLIGIPSAMLCAEHQRTRAEIQKRLDALRAAGQPLTPQDLAKLYPDPPPEQDASLLLKPALELLSIPDAFTDDSTNLLYFGLELPRSAPLDPSAVAEGRRWLDRNQAAFALMPWSQLEHAWFGSGFANGLTNLTEAPLSKMNRLGQLLCLNAVLEAEQQHPREAMQSLQRAAIIGNTLKNDLPVDFLAKATAQSRISLALQRIMNRVNLPDTELVSFPNFLTLTNIGATRESWIINQRPLALFTADLFESEIGRRTRGVVSPGRRLIRTYDCEMLYHPEDLLQYLDWSDDSLAALDSPVSKAIPMLRNIEELQDEALNHRHIYLDVFKRRRFSVFTAEEPQFSRAFLGELNTVAQVRVAVAALAVERWRSAHGGAFPGSLAELAPHFLPAIPADPFDGRPLRYKKLAKGFVIYSIGEDLTGDGGKEENPEASAPKHDDITFTVDQ